METPATLKVSELLNRRAFSRHAIAAASLGILPVSSIVKQDSAAPGHNTLDIGEKPEDLSIPNWEEVRTRYANVLRVYGARLSPEQKQRIARILTENQHMLASVRAFVVQNGDASACTLRLDVSK
jgi:hypothetical protein